MNMSELKDAVVATFDSHRTPILIGDPGVGKTAFAADLGERVGGRSVIINLSHKDGAEVHGLPMMGESRNAGGRAVPATTVAPPDYAVEAVNSDKPTVILYDELTSVSSSQIAPALAIFADRMLGGLYLDPRKIHLIACCNPSAIAAGGFDLPPPMANRLRFFDFKVDPLEWSKNFPGYWGKPPALGARHPKMTDDQWENRSSALEMAWAESRVEVAAYIRHRPAALNAMPKERAKQAEAWPSCRSWDFVSRSLAISKVDNLGAEIVLGLVSGDIGHSHATEFLTWRETAGLIDVGALLRNPKSFKMPQSVDLQFHLMSTIPLFVVNAYKYGNTEVSVSAQTGKKGKTGRNKHGSEMWMAAWEIVDMFVKAGGSKDLALITADRLVQPDCQAGDMIPPKSIQDLAKIMESLKLSQEHLS